LGVCFGHQLLARAMGGMVARNPRGREMGTITVTLNSSASKEPIFSGVPATFCAQATHQDTVIEAPSMARVLATSSKDNCQAFAVGNHAWGVQFHPEITAPILRGYVRARSEALRSEGACPDSVYNSVRDRVEGERVLSNFIAMAFAN
jgi:GMP synthase (glutamine-hydrolysing)